VYTVPLSLDWSIRTLQSFWFCKDNKPTTNTFLHCDNSAGGCRYRFIGGSQWGPGLGVWCYYHLGSWHGISYPGKQTPLDNLCFFQASLTTACFLTVALDLQANTYDELPGQLLGAARLSNIEPSAAVNPELDSISWAGWIKNCADSFILSPKPSPFVEPLQHFAVRYNEAQTDSAAVRRHHTVLSFFCLLYYWCSLFTANCYAVDIPKTIFSVRLAVAGGRCWFVVREK